MFQFYKVSVFLSVSTLFFCQLWRVSCELWSQTEPQSPRRCKARSFLSGECQYGKLKINEPTQFAINEFSVMLET